MLWLPEILVSVADFDCWTPYGYLRRRRRRDSQVLSGFNSSSAAVCGCTLYFAKHMADSSKYIVLSPESFENKNSSPELLEPSPI